MPYVSLNKFQRRKHFNFNIQQSYYGLRFDNNLESLNTTLVQNNDRDRTVR